MPKLSGSRLSPPEFKVALGRRIAAARALQGLSQGEVAEKLHILQTAFSRIERGVTDCSIPRLHRIANVLNTNITTLLEGLL